MSIMVPRAGLEPATLGLEVLCSIQLSYQGAPISIVTNASSLFWCGWRESDPPLQLGRLAY
jgi:hypothetical protein